MKLKFEPEVQKIIDAIAQLPDTPPNLVGLGKPNSVIAGLDHTLLRQRDTKQIPSKQWAKLRRQLSFLYELVLMSTWEGTKAHPPVPGQEASQASQASKEETYRFLVRATKDMQSGQALARPEFVRLALNYGVLYLSDHEINKLIENNKIE